MAIYGSYAATTGTAGATTTVGGHRGDEQPGYTTARLTCDAAGAGVWTTPQLVGIVTLISIKNADFATLTALGINIVDAFGAKICPNQTMPAATLVISMPGDFSSGIDGPLTITATTAIGNASKGFDINIYVQAL